jgi:hypothetical protein
VEKTLPTNGLEGGCVHGQDEPLNNYTNRIRGFV